MLEAAGWRSVSLERIIGELERLRAGASVAEVAAAVGSLCQRGALVEQAGWYERTGRVEPLGEGRR